MEKTYYIGIDIGGTKCAVTVADETCCVLEKERFDTCPEKGYAYAVTKILSAARAFAEKYPAKAIGVSCGGPLDGRAGVILSPPNLPGWEHVEINRLLNEATGLPAFLQNDADACAIAEWKFGAGRGSENMIFLTFGTGMGAGLILNGRLYTGGCNMAGEVGHMRLYDAGHTGYGKAGSFEGYCSGGGIAQYGKGSAKKLCERAAAGDAQALALWEKIGDDLGRGLAVLIDLLNPDVIVIGSIYQRAQQFLEQPTRRAIAREALARSAGHARILPAQLGDGLGDVAAVCVAINGLETAKAANYKKGSKA